MNASQAVGHLSEMLFSTTTVWLLAISLGGLFLVLNIYLLVKPTKVGRLLSGAGVVISTLVLTGAIALLTIDKTPNAEYSLLSIVLWLGTALPIVSAVLLALGLALFVLISPSRGVWAVPLIVLVGVGVLLLQKPIQTQVRAELIAKFTTLPNDGHLVVRPDKTPPTKTRITSGVPMQFIAAGPFLQGSIDQAQQNKIVRSRLGDEYPIKTRELTSYWIDRYEVTIEQFSRFVASTSYLTETEKRNAGRRWTAEDGWILNEGLSWRNPMSPGDNALERLNHPVTQVTWWDADAFCKWRSARLPSAAEWEKAARGYDSRRYPWGNNFDPTLANSCGSKCLKHGLEQEADGDDGYEFTAPVGSFPGGVSPYGAFDMAGNVWEFVSDFYDPFYSYYAPRFDPQGPGSGDRKIVKGGSFLSASSYLRTSSKSFDPLDEAYFGVGFRCAKDALPSDK